MQLYAADPVSLLRYTAPEVRLWASLHRGSGRNGSLVDRAGLVDAPFNFRIYPACAYAAVAGAPSLTYEECCDRRARELLALQEHCGVPLALLYSGGIDSTLALISFAKVLGAAQLRERIHVYLSHDSVLENPGFYFAFVRRHCTLRASEDLPRLLDGSHLLVAGGHNEELFGSGLIAWIAGRHPLRRLRQAYSRRLVLGFLLEAGMDARAAGCWFELLHDHIQRLHAPVTSVFEFFWWLNFIFGWQAAHFRILLQAGRRPLDDPFCERRYHQFYSPAYFQKWAMANPGLKIRKSWASYKFPARDLIYEFTGDEDYWQNKAGVASLERLHLPQPAARGLNTQFDLLDALRDPGLYNLNNSFRGAGARRFVH